MISIEILYEDEPFHVYDTVCIGGWTINTETIYKSDKKVWS